MPERFAATIFDFDGVLVHSEPLHEWAIRECITARGWSFSSEFFYREVVGKGDENAFRAIAEHNSAPISDAEIATELQRKWGLMAQGIAAGKFQVQPGAVEAVLAAKERGPVAVCSGSVRMTVEAMLGRSGLREALDALVCGDDVARMKPAPDGYLEAARRLGVRPNRCLAIEDTPTGIRAARQAGMYVVGVCHTYTRECLPEADEVLESIQQLWARLSEGRADR